MFYWLVSIRQLEGVLERLVSCRSQRSQAESRLAEIQRQTSNLPHVFSWPGLGERRQAMEQARTLLDRSTALAPVLSDLHKQVRSLSIVTVSFIRSLKNTFPACFQYSLNKAKNM